MELTNTTTYITLQLSLCAIFYYCPACVQKNHIEGPERLSLETTGRNIDRYEYHYVIVCVCVCGNFPST